MDNRSTGGPAFPTGSQPEPNLYSAPGMTLRDYFAAAAMQALIGTHEPETPDMRFGLSTDPANVVFAGAAYQMADAMLEARQ